MAGGKLVKEGLGFAADGIEYATRENGIDLEGYAQRIRVRLAPEDKMAMRLFNRYVEPLLDQMTGGKGTGASDILQLAFIFGVAAKDQYEFNQTRAPVKQVALMPQAQSATTAGVAYPGVGAHARLEGMVRQEMGPEPSATPDAAVANANTNAMALTPEREDAEAMKRWEQSIRTSLTARKEEVQFEKV